MSSRTIRRDDSPLGSSWRHEGGVTTVTDGDVSYRTPTDALAAVNEAVRNLARDRSLDIDPVVLFLNLLECMKSELDDVRNDLYGATVDIQEQGGPGAELALLEETNRLARLMALERNIEKAMFAVVTTNVALARKHTKEEQQMRFSPSDTKNRSRR